MAFLKALVDGNEREVSRLRRTANAVNAFESRMAALSDDELRNKTVEFRERLAAGESLDAMLPETFAVVREAGKRTLGMRHFDVQIMGGQVLFEGRIAEMKTGEGKTLVATLAGLRASARRSRRDGRHGQRLLGASRRRVDVANLRSAGPDRRHHPARSRPGATPSARTTATSRTSPTTKSASTICATTWRGRSKIWCSASCTSRWSTKSIRFWSTKRVRR